jgi:hypothetical protein
VSGDGSAQKTLRYVVRDRDGEVVQEGVVYSLVRALELELVGHGKSRIRCAAHSITDLLGPYVLWPDVEKWKNDCIELF